jgi:hypothetical protein
VLLSRTQVTFLGGSMAMASFCGMEICTGLAESCLSLLRDRRNCLFGGSRSAFGSLQTPVGRTTRDATHLDHGRTLGSTSQSRSGAGGLGRRNKQWVLWVEPASQGLHCAVCSLFCARWRLGVKRSTQRSLLSGARRGVSCWRVVAVGVVVFPLCDDSAGSRRSSWTVGNVGDVVDSGGDARGETVPF